MLAFTILVFSQNDGVKTVHRYCPQKEYTLHTQKNQRINQLEFFIILSLGKPHKNTDIMQELSDPYDRIFHIWSSKIQKSSKHTKDVLKILFIYNCCKKIGLKKATLDFSF